MAKPDIWMPLYIADYLADTNRLSTVQHGAYLLLMIDYWRNGRLPNCRETLLQITRLSDDAWSMLQALLTQFFTLSDDGKWVHGRIEVELQAAKENRDKSKAKAKAAAEARWTNAKSNAPSMLQALPEALLQQCPSPSPSPMSLSPNGDKSESGDSAHLPDPCPHQEIVALFNEILASQGLTAVIPSSWPGSKRAAYLKSRWREAPNRQSLDWWRGFFGHVANSPFLMGKNDRNWQPTLEWLLKRDNFDKVCEGVYHRG